MKKTLYEILGVDPKASLQQIEVAYGKRLEELSVATIRDPNKLVVLKQAKEILSDSNQRAAYDASLAALPAVSQARPDQTTEPSFFQAWGKPIVLGAILFGVGAWWVMHDGSSPAPEPAAPPQTLTNAEPTPEDPPADQPVETVAVKEDAASVIPPQPQDDTPASPVAGSWSCFDPVSGSAGRYDFRPDGTLTVSVAGGQAVSRNYAVSGSIIKLEDSNQPASLTIEQLTASRMILNTGSEGRRLVCTR